MIKDCPLIKKCLQGLKGLSEKEAEAFLEICSRKQICVKDAMQILVDIKASKQSRSTAYNLVEKLENGGLIFSVGNSTKKQQYKAIHPRDLLNELKISLKNVEKEMPKLEEAYETSDYEVEDPRLLCRTLQSESEISTTCHDLHKDHDLVIIHDKNSSTKGYLQRLSDCGKVIEGKINVILFRKKKNGKKGVIQISTRLERTGNVRIYGHIIFDEDKYKYFHKNEVKKK